MDAASHNGETFQAFNNHLGDVIQAFPGSTLSYGSEFRPPEQLHHIWGGHPSWSKLNDTLSHGSSYELNEVRQPHDRVRDLAHLHEYGNHKSATSVEGLKLASDLLHEDVFKQRAIPIPPSLVDSIVGSELCPIGIVHQNTINDRGEMIDKSRACHDHTYHGGPSNSSLNLRTNKDLLHPCEYGHALRRILHQAHFLRLECPDTPILISKADLDAAYRRMTCIWHLAVQCICIIGSLAYLLLRLPFGAAAAPSEFCVASEALCDLANNLLADHTWEPGETKTPWDDILPAPNLLDPSLPYAKARPLDVTPPYPEHNGKCDVYIDDIITIGLYLPQLIARLQQAVIMAIHCLFRPMHPSEAGHRNHVLSLRKLAGDGALCEIKVVLGWLINT